MLKDDITTFVLRDEGKIRKSFSYVVAYPEHYIRVLGYKQQRIECNETQKIIKTSSTFGIFIS